MLEGSLALLELRMEVQRAEAAAKALPFPAPHGTYEDHRTEIVGGLLGALDRIDPGLGTRLQLAMCPRASACMAHGERRVARGPESEIFGIRILGEDMTITFGGRRYSAANVEGFAAGMHVQVQRLSDAPDHAVHLRRVGPLCNTIAEVALHPMPGAAS